MNLYKFILILCYFCKTVISRVVLFLFSIYLNISNNINAYYIGEIATHNFQTDFQVTLSVTCPRTLL